MDKKINLDDQKLIDTAKSIIEKNFVSGKHHVGSAVRSGSGKVYTGIHMESNTTDVCAESVALGTAFSNGEKEIESIVAVTLKNFSSPKIIPPCRACQDLINFYNPNAGVIFEENGEIKKRMVKEGNFPESW